MESKYIYTEKPDNDIAKRTLELAEKNAKRAYIRDIAMALGFISTFVFSAFTFHKSVSTQLKLAVAETKQALLLEALRTDEPIKKDPLVKLITDDFSDPISIYKAYAYEVATQQTSQYVANYQDESVRNEHVDMSKFASTIAMIEEFITTTTVSSTIIESSSSRSEKQETLPDFIFDSHVLTVKSQEDNPLLGDPFQGLIYLSLTDEISKYSTVNSPGALIHSANYANIDWTQVISSHKSRDDYLTGDLFNGFLHAKEKDSTANEIWNFPISIESDFNIDSLDSGYYLPPFLEGKASGYKYDLGIDLIHLQTEPLGVTEYDYLSLLSQDSSSVLFDLDIMPVNNDLLIK